MKNFGCHGNELPIKEILYQSVFGDKYYTIGHKFTISVTMDVSPFAWCLGRAVLNFEKKQMTKSMQDYPACKELNHYFAAIAIILNVL